MMALRFFCLWSLLLMGLAGWNLGCSAPTTSPSCTQDSDCVRGEICRQNSCVRNTGSGCQKDKDCYNGLKCELATGQCVRCLNDADCNTGQRCSAGQCSSGSGDAGHSEQTPESPESTDNLTDTGPSCRSDADCRPQEICELPAGRCVLKVGKTCQKDGDCLADTYCDAGSCTPGRRSCQTHTDCQQDFDCRSGFCYRKTCQLNQDCPPGETCDATKGQCNPANPQDCTQSGCPAGQTCNPTTKQCENIAHCAQSGCPAGQSCNSTTGRCEISQDCTQSGCPTGQTCNSTTKQCETTGSGCTSDASCIPPQGSCFQGKCVSCSQSGCATGLWCNAASGTCIPTPPKCSTDTDCSAPTGTCMQGGCLSCASHFSCSAPTVCDRSTGKCNVPPCSSDMDCTPPKGSCQAGKCVSCSTDFSCPTGDQCQASSGRCIPPQPTCTSDSQCSAPYGTCRAGACDSCLNFSCPSGQSCSASTGRCITSSTCATDSQCSSPLGWCRNGSCTSCILYTCPTGQSCNSSTGRCTATSACTADSQCSTPDGWCRNGSCTTCLFYSCDSSLRCNSSTGRCEPRTCTNNQDCRAPRAACYQGKCLTCNGDFTCPTDQTCEVSTGLCQPKPQCIKHQDCGTGQLCLSSRCVRSECNLVKACSPGQRCYGRACVPVYTRCYSYLCGAQESCLYGPDKTDTCHKRCSGAIPCSTNQECLTVSLKDGGSDKFCFNKPSLDVNASCTPGNLSKRCKNDGVCIITSSFSSTGYCYDRCTPGSSLGCKSTQECAELSPGQGLCLSKGSKTSGSYCGILSDRCQSSHECLPSGLSSSSSGTCYQRCNAPGGSGTSVGCQAKEVCIASAFSNNTGICAPEGTRQDGSSCTLFSSYQCLSSLACSTDPSGYSDEGVCQARCQSASNCPSSGEDCVQGVCLPKPTGSDGSSCRFDSSVGSYHCKQGFACVIDPESSSSYGTCKKTCQTDADCPSTTYNQCVRGYCERKGTLSEHNSCSQSSTSSQCKSGLVCASVSSFSYRCLQTCQSNSECGTSYPDCASGFCLPKGTLKEDAYCYDSLTSRCEAGLQCATPPGSSFSSRRCFRSCNANSDCTGTYKVCGDSSDGSRVCYK